jgi:hypothetical protein
MPKENFMDHVIAKEVAALARMTVTELRARFAELFHEPPRANNRTWLIKRIAWRLQALAEGDLSERARLRAVQLANDADLRLSPPAGCPAGPSQGEATPAPPPPALVDGRLPRPGTVITRRYKGQTLRVHVLDRGLAFNGKVHQSLSAVAKAITGSHCNGYLFFGLNKQEATS